MTDLHPVMEPVFAALDLLGRAGATEAEFAFDGADDATMDEVTWWMSVRWRGNRQFVDGQPTPEAAATALLLRTIEGGQCVRCGKPVHLGGLPFTDRTPDIDRCRWYRVGRKWHRGCDCSSEPLTNLNRAQRRRKARAKHLGGRP